MFLSRSLGGLTVALQGIKCGCGKSFNLATSKTGKIIMATKFSRKQRLFFAVGFAIAFTFQKVYVASQQMDVTLVLILGASLMPIFYGVIIY